MSFGDLLLIESPAVLAVAAGFILFVVVFTILSRVNKEKGFAAVVALALGLIAGWALYRNDFYGWEYAISIVLAVVVLGVFAKILWAFIKGFKRNF